MTWRQALHIFTDSADFRELNDPFWVPDRWDEVSSFILTALQGGLLIWSLIALPMTVKTAVVLAVMSLIAVAALVTGMRKRSYRLMRIRKVADLRAGLAHPTVD